MKYISQRRLENLPEVVRKGTNFGEVGEYRLNKDMPRERFLATLELQEIIEKYF